MFLGERSFSRTKTNKVKGPGLLERLSTDHAEPLVVMDAKEWLAAHQDLCDQADERPQADPELCKKVGKNVLAPAASSYSMWDRAS